MWSAYKTLGASPERDEMRAEWPKSSEFISGNGFYLFVTTHPNPIDPVDATHMTTEVLISLIDTHTGPNAVLVSKDQAQEVFELLRPDLDTPT